MKLRNMFKMINAMTFLMRSLSFAILTLGLWLAAGCASTGDEQGSFPTVGNPGPNPQAAQVARFSVGDTVTISLSGPPDEIAPHVETIKEDGTITMPDIGHVKALGLTAGELQNSIHDLYVPKIYTHLTVSVTSGDRVYYVSGEVKQPGRQLYVGETTVTRAITSAGDFTDYANRKSVWLVRGNRRLKIDCEAIFRNPEKDPLVYPGDRIEVRRQIF